MVRMRRTASNEAIEVEKKERPGPDIVIMNDPPRQDVEWTLESWPRAIPKVQVEQ